MGEKSIGIGKIRNMRDRIGPSIGSVTVTNTLVQGSRPTGSTQDKSARAIIAKTIRVSMRFAKLNSVSMLYHFPFCWTVTYPIIREFT